MKLGEVMKAHMWRKAEAAIRRGGSRPMLFSFASDGTPCLAMEYLSHEVTGDSKQKARRVGGRGSELLIERGYLKIQDEQGQWQQLALVRDPRPLENGKSAWHHVVACCQFFPLLRSKKSLTPGIVITHYSFDRAVFSAAARHLHERHAVWHWHHQRSGVDSEAKKKALCEWDVSTGCANHDCQNSLDWCLRPTVSDAKDTVKRLYVVCKSLRDGFSLVADGIVSFVNEKLSYDPEPWDHQEVYAFWSAFWHHVRSG